LNSDVFGKTNVLSNEIFSCITPVKTPTLPLSPSIKTLSFGNKKSEKILIPSLPPASTPLVKNKRIKKRYIYKFTIKDIPLRALMNDECVGVE